MIFSNLCKFILFPIVICGCSHEAGEASANIITTGNITINEKIKYLTTTISDSINLYFDSLSYEVSVSIQQKIGVSKPYSIGKFHSTFGQPPTEVSVYSVNAEKIVFVVVCNFVQLGIESNDFNVLLLNTASHNVEKLCYLDEIGILDEMTGMDTLSDILNYTYEINSLGNDRYRLQVEEYVPYKYVGSQIARHTKYSSKTHLCDFQIN